MSCPWPHCVLRYDGSFAGFLTCVAESFRLRVYPCCFQVPHQPPEDRWPLYPVATDRDLARRVYAWLAAAPALRELVTRGMLTSLPQRERLLFDLIWLWVRGEAPLEDGRAEVVRRAVRVLDAELAAVTAGLRLRDVGGLLVGQIAPRDRLLPLLGPQLSAARPERGILLHDRTHRELLCCDGGRWRLRAADRLDPARPEEVAALWRRGRPEEGARLA